MILYRWQGSARNFGDELNTILWPRLLPDFFDDDPSARFLGIGSILDRRHAGPSRKLVAGAGYGGYEGTPTLDHAWDIRWVRGPRTARTLGLPPAAGLGDPAALLPFTNLIPSVPRSGVGFMPHFESVAGGAWTKVAAAVGVRLIDPRGDPLAIAKAIGGCEVLLSEALHGVIVADTFGVPWIAIQPLAPVHRAKWHDWADTLNLRVAFQHLSASSLWERARHSRLAQFHAGRALLETYRHRWPDLGSRSFLDQAAGALSRAAASTPQLSGRSALDRSQSQMLGCLDQLRRAYLRPGGGSAYHRSRPG